MYLFASHHRDCVWRLRSSRPVAAACAAISRGWATAKSPFDVGSPRQGERLKVNVLGFGPFGTAQTCREGLRRPTSAVGLGQAVDWPAYDSSERSFHPERRGDDDFARSQGRGETHKLGVNELVDSRLLAPPPRTDTETGAPLVGGGWDAAASQRGDA